MNEDKPVENPSDYYDRSRHLYLRLQEEVNFILTTATHEAGIKSHSLTTRVKEKSSYLEKIQRKGYEDYQAAVEDAVGARIVCLFTSDLPTLRTIIHDSFEVITEEDKVEGQSIEAFGYMSIHYICRLHSGHAGPRYDGLGNLKFEVQCRTILMDAWANVSHYLAYKGEDSIPAELRRDFHALAGLFYVADKHFEIFFRQSKYAELRTVESFAQGEDQSEAAVDRDTVFALLGQIYSDRLEETAENALSSAAEFAEELVRAGYENITEVENDLRRGAEAALHYERAYPPFSEIGSRYHRVGIARAAIAIVNDTYLQQKYHGSARDYARFRQHVTDV